MRLIMLVSFMVMIVIAPLLVIWALNTLFHLGIPYQLDTWFAALVLGGSATITATFRK